MLTLMEESALLFAWSIEEAQSTSRGLALSTSLAPLLQAAPRMELALRGRVQMSRFKPIRHRSRWRRSAALTLLRIALGVVVLGLSLAVVKQSWIIYLWPDSFALAVFLCTYVLSRRVVATDLTPTGDVLLDEALQELELARAHAAMRIWVRHGPHPPPKDGWAILSGRLEAQGALSASAPLPETPLISTGEPGALLSAFSGQKSAPRNQVVTGMTVNTQGEAWQQISQRMRGVLTGEQRPDTQTMALLLLVTLGDLRRWTKLPRKDAILYHLCPPEARAAAHTRLTVILKGDEELAGQVGEGLYDTLLGIRDCALERRCQP